MHATTAPVSPLAPYGATLLRLALGVLFLQRDLRTLRHILGYLQR